MYNLYAVQKNVRGLLELNKTIDLLVLKIFNFRQKKPYFFI